MPKASKHHAFSVWNEVSVLLKASELRALWILTEVLTPSEASALRSLDPKQSIGVLLKASEFRAIWILTEVPTPSEASELRALWI